MTWQIRRYDFLMFAELIFFQVEYRPGSNDIATDLTTAYRNYRMDAIVRLLKIIFVNYVNIDCRWSLTISFAWQASLDEQFHIYLVITSSSQWYALQLWAYLDRGQDRANPLFKSIWSINQILLVVYFLKCITWHDLIFLMHHGMLVLQWCDMF